MKKLTKEGIEAGIEVQNVEPLCFTVPASLYHKEGILSLDHYAKKFFEDVKNCTDCGAKLDEKHDQKSHEFFKSIS